MTLLYPRSLATSASAMPVLPAVPSTIVPPACSAPRASASSTMPRAARSFTDPPGLRNSALPKHAATELSREFAQFDQRRVADRAGEAVDGGHGAGKWLRLNGESAQARNREPGCF